jgi:aminoglycoside phosphotransferase (APT) family kinase protein
MYEENEMTSDPPATDLGAALTPWLRRRLEKPALSVVGLKPASEGFSAQTLFATLRAEPLSASDEIVLRLEYPGREIFLDTDIGRQAQVMEALVAQGIPAPSLIGVELDQEPIGRRFIAMRRSPGRPFPTSSVFMKEGWVKDLSPEARTTLWRNALGMLAKINRLDWRQGFEFLNRPQYGAPGLDQYLGWLRAWYAAVMQGDPHLTIDAGLEYLDRNRPHELPTAVVWGDSNPNNMLFGSDLSVSAVLDFEAAALGTAEVDLGWWLFMDRRRSHGQGAFPGKPDRAASVAMYEQALGRAAVAVDYFEVIGGIRMALVIAQTVRRLREVGLLDASNDAPTHNPIVVVLAELLGRAAPEPGQGFRDFVAAVSKR